MTAKIPVLRPGIVSMPLPILVFVPAFLPVWISMLAFVFLMAGPTTLPAAQERTVDRELRDRVRKVPDPFKGAPPPGTVSVVGRSFVKSAVGGSSNNIIFLEAVNNEKIRNDLGLSEDQVAQLRTMRNELRAQTLVKGAQYAAKFKKMGSKEDQNSIEQEISADIAQYTAKIKALASEEQMQKARTIVFQASGGLDSPFIHSDTLDTLKLSEDQKKQAKKVFDETEAKRLELMEEGLKLAEKAVAMGGRNISEEDRAKLREEARLLEAKIYESGRSLGDALRPMLTEEQKTLAVRLMANRPDYLPRMPRRFQERLDLDGGYQPGAGSWRPGLGVPEEADDVEKPKTRGQRGFPRAR